MTRGYTDYGQGVMSAASSIVDALKAVQAMKFDLMSQKARMEYADRKEAEQRSYAKEEFDKEMEYKLAKEQIEQMRYLDQLKMQQAESDERKRHNIKGEELDMARLGIERIRAKNKRLTYQDYYDRIKNSNYKTNPVYANLLSYLESIKDKNQPIDDYTMDLMTTSNDILASGAVGTRQKDVQEHKHNLTIDRDTKKFQQQTYTMLLKDGLVKASMAATPTEQNKQLMALKERMDEAKPNILRMGGDEDEFNRLHRMYDELNNSITGGVPSNIDRTKLIQDTAAWLGSIPEDFGFNGLVIPKDTVQDSSFSWDKFKLQ